MSCPLDYDENVECRRTHPKLLPNNEADTVRGILEMRPKRVRVEDNEQAVKLASNSRSANIFTQAIVDGGKSMSQRAENKPLVQRMSVLDGSTPRGSGVGTGHKNKYPTGILYPPVAKYLSSKPDIAKRKRLLSGLIERLRAGLPMPSRYIGTHIQPIRTFGKSTLYVGRRTDYKYMGRWQHPIMHWQPLMEKCQCTIDRCM